MTAAEPLPDFDLYAELGVRPTADRLAIEAAFRSLMKVHHPDIAADPASGAERGKRLNVARQWLTDPLRRARYDRALGLDRPRLSTDWQPGPASADDLLHVRVRRRRYEMGIPFGAFGLIGLMLLMASFVLIELGPLGLFAIIGLPIGLMMFLYGTVGLIVGFFVRRPRD